MRTDTRLSTLAEGISVLAKQMSNQPRGAQATSDPAIFERIAVGQEKMLEALQKQAAEAGDSGDAESRMRLRNIDVQLLRVLEEISAGLQDSISEIRQDLATLIYTLQQAVDAGKD
jgi:transaldolase